MYLSSVADHPDVLSSFKLDTVFPPFFVLFRIIGTYINKYSIERAQGMYIGDGTEVVGR